MTETDMIRLLNLARMVAKLLPCPIRVIAHQWRPRLYRLSLLRSFGQSFHYSIMCHQGAPRLHAKDQPPHVQLTGYSQASPVTATILSTFSKRQLTRMLFSGDKDEYTHAFPVTPRLAITVLAGPRLPNNRSPGIFRPASAISAS